MLTTPWMSRLAAVLLLIATIGAAYSLLAEPLLIGYRETNRAIEAGREQLRHFQRLAATRPALAKQLEKMTAEEGAETYYLSGGTDALAAASLQDRVSSLVDGNGASLRSLQPLLGIDEQGFRRITVHVEITATIGPLFETLYALETGMPVLFVENLDIQSRLARRRASQPGMQVAADDEPLLTVGFDLSGYMPLERQ
jgi:general secretion pathway protein M